jgi:two-component system cell cycle sensor histidine kinase/response regulator CckA
MRDETHTPKDAAALRRRAEDRLRATTSPPHKPRTAAETRRILHELQVHQIELEMQNEELRQARDELDASLDRYTTLYDYAPVGYLTLDRAGTIRAVNLTGASLLGGERAGIVGTPLSRFLSPDTRPAFQAVLATVLAGRSKGVCDVSLLTPAAPPRFVRIEATAAEDGEECRAALIDVTDRIRWEEEQLLRTKLEATGVLAAGIAHDFNNLLMVILGSIELLGEPGQDPAQHRAAALQAVLEARGLTQQFLTFAKGGRPVRKALVLTGVLRGAATLVLRGAPIACDFALPEDLCSIEGDATQVGQVFQNLLLNAREAMPAGGRIAIRAENVAEPAPAVRVTIVDSGPGIPTDILPRVFDPYFSTKQRGDRKSVV